MYGICAVGPPTRMPETFVSAYRTRLPSFHEFTESLASPPTPPPSAATSSNSLTASSTPDHTCTGTQPSIATLVNPAPPSQPANGMPAGTPVELPRVVTPSPTTWSPPEKPSRWPEPQHTVAAPLVYSWVLPPDLQNTTPAGGDRQYRPPSLAPAVSDVALPLSWGYIEALCSVRLPPLSVLEPPSQQTNPAGRQLNAAAYSLYDFSKRFKEHCQPQPILAPEGGATISAQLPSRQMVSQMAGNAAIIKKKLEEVAHIVKRVAEMQREDEEEAAAAAAAAAAATAGVKTEGERRQSAASMTPTAKAGSEGGAMSEDGEQGGGEAKVKGRACRVSKVRTRSRGVHSNRK